MIPDQRLSTTPVPAGYREPTARPDPLVDYEMGGVALQDPSEGLLVKLWTVRYDTTAEQVLLSAPGVTETVAFTRGNITQVSLAFDQSMNPFIAFVEAGISKFWWYDPTVPGQVFEESLIATAITPQCTLDDKRPSQTGNSDIILAYVREGAIYYRQQRDRYLIEYPLLASVSGGLKCVGMNTKLRLQFDLEGSGSENWTLPDIIQDISARANLSDDRLNLRMMDYAKIVRGYTIGNAYAASGILQTLSSVFFFDPFGANGEVGFVPRGRDAVATIYDQDMIDDGEEVEDSSTRRGDSISIPRVLHLNYYDVAGGLNTDKQRSERPEGTRAEGEQSLQTPVTMTADEAATVVAMTHGLIVEQQKGDLNFRLPDSWLSLTESDPVFVQAGTKMVRAIITRAETDDGEQAYKAIRDRQSLYTTQVQGIPAAPVTRPPSSVAGPTLVEFLDIPVLRDADDLLGFRVAVYGILPAWPGASVELSLDGGASYIYSQTTRSGSVVGELVSALGDHPYAYPDSVSACQVLIATPNALLENTTLAGMMNRSNRAIIGNEIVNFADADEVTEGTWVLSYWLRGRKGTATAAHEIGERFVLLNTTMFIPAELSWLNRTLTFRATSSGRPVDEATITSVVFTGQSQVERQPAYLQARRDGSDIVASWQGVGRLGGGANVAMGVQFAGFRVTLTDGSVTQTFDQLTQTITTPLSAFAGPITVRIQQRNNFTGLGPAIEVTI